LGADNDRRQTRHVRVACVHTSDSDVQDAANAAALADADAVAFAHRNAHGHAVADAVAFADLNACADRDADADACANRDAYADADACADDDTGADSDAGANACANTDACADADTSTDADADPGVAAMKRMHKRAAAVVDVLIATGVLLIVLGFVAVLLRQAFTHHTLTTENMSNEQQARIALARINSSLSQATIEANPNDFPGGPAAPVILTGTPFPTATSASSIAFYRVSSLDPATVPSPGGAPMPSYTVHIITYDPVAQTIDEYVVDEPSYVAGVPSPAPAIVARNVTAFGIMAIPKTNEYQFQITINDVANVSQAEQPMTLVDNVHIMQ